MRMLKVTAVDDGAALGTISLSGGGELSFSDPGTADMLRAARARIGDDSKVFDLYAGGWSNGYVTIEPEETIAGGGDPTLDEIQAMADEEPFPSAARARELALLGVTRAAGHDVTPGHDQLHHYWTRGEGLAKWAESPKPWTTLVAHLTRHVGLRKAKIFASRWFIEVFHYAAGSDKNRVAHGHPPRGHRVGPG